jgi:DNA polymerase-3 subunit epsilon
MRPWKTEPIAAWDLETTGISPEENAIREIGVVQSDGGEFCTLVKPWEPIPAEVVEKLKISPEYIEEMNAVAPFTAETARKFMEDLGGRILLTYNGESFDRPFMAAEMRRVGVDPSPLFALPLLDALLLAGIVFEKKRMWQKMTLGEVAATCGCGLVNAHTATADCRMTLGILRRIERHLPDDLSELLDLQAEECIAKKKDFEEYMWWFRRTPQGLRVSCGKNSGVLLSDLDTGFLAWATKVPKDLPPAVSAAFKAEMKIRMIEKNRRT